MSMLMPGVASTPTKLLNQCKENVYSSMWIHFLGCGEFNQGAKYLHRIENGIEYYSTLGLLCAALFSGFVGEWIPVELEDRTISRYLFQDIEQTFFLDQSVLDLVGLDISHQIYLSQLNDNGWSFKEIAQEIRDGFPSINKSSGIFIPSPPSLG